MTYSIDLECFVHEDGLGYRVELTIRGLPTRKAAGNVALWMRDALRENVSQIGILDPTASHVKIEPNQ